MSNQATDPAGPMGSQTTAANEAAARLGLEPYVSLATFRLDGRAVETPVWVVERDGRLFVFTEAVSWKVKRLRRDPRVRVTPCNVRGVRRGSAIPGRGHVLDDPQREPEIYREFGRKYGWQMKLVNFFSRLAGRIDGRALLEIELLPEVPRS